MSLLPLLSLGWMKIVVCKPNRGPRPALTNVEPREPFEFTVEIND